jgi:hypothetical protein
MTKFRKSTRLGAAALSVLMLVTLPTVAVAWDRRVEEGWDHFVECVGWLWWFTDIPSYEAYCLPPRVPEYPEGATTPQGGAPPSSSYEPPVISSEPPSTSSSILA